MKRIIFGMILLVVSVNSLYSELYYQMGFETLATDEQLTRSMFVSAGFGDPGWSQGLDTRSLVDVEHSSEGAKAMRIMYPGGGKAGVQNTGAQIPLMFKDKSADEIYASYSLKPSDNFTWGKTQYGGKLPGLASGTQCSGDKVCSGTNGFSARYMWRDGGRLVLLLYHMDYTKIYGEDLDLIYPDGRTVVAERGKWIHLTQRIKMNTVTIDANGNAVANPDGIIQVWANGELVLNRTDIRLRTNDDLIDNFYISTFHGGGDETWAPTEDCYIWFDDIRIGSSYDDVKYTTCENLNLGADKSACVKADATFEVDSQSNVSYEWFKDRQSIEKGASLSVSEPGTYVLVADSMGCSRRDTILFTSDLRPILPEKVTICEQSFVILDPKISSDGVVFEWSKDGQKLFSSDSKLVVKDGGVYKVKVSSSDCESAEAEVEVLSGLLAIDDVTAEKGAMVEITVSGNGNYSWYDSESGGELLSEGVTFSTSMPSSPTYLFVKDNDGFSGLVGKKGITGKTYTYSNSSMDKTMTEAWMTFTVMKDLTIDSVSLYPYSLPCDVVIKILNNETGEEVYYNSFNLPVTGANRVPLNAELKPGVYRFDMAESSGILKQSHSDLDIQFPYVIDGLISIDGANKEKSWMNKVGGRFLAVYDWRVSTGNHCAATPVLLSPLGGTKNMDAEHGNIVVYPTRVEDNLYIEGLNGDTKVTIFNSLGVKKMYKQTKTDKMQISLSQWPNGEYILQIEERESLKSLKIVK